jgi:3-deoxy-D-manno-octulosonic-acid transferase
MTYLWNLVYLIVGFFAIPFLLWQRFARGKRRAGWAAKFLGNVNYATSVHSQPSVESSSKMIWFHAVSVGEVNLLDPLLKLIATESPEWQIYITVGTVSGFELAQKKYPSATISYAPLDFSWAVHRAIERIRPSMLVLVELELWPNLISIAHTKKIPIVVINGRLSAKSFRGYSRIRFLVSPILEKMSLIAAQNEEYASRFTELGASAEKVKITGSLKFDGARSDRDTPEIKELKTWAGFRDEDIAMVAGSTSEPEEEIIIGALQLIRAEFPKFKLVIVPRHPERFEQVAKLISQHSGGPIKRRSDSKIIWPGVPDCDFPCAGPSIILVDRIGELGHWWGTATIGFVGGSLTQRGGQNMIEPAAFGVATCFGPNTWNFRDVVQMLLADKASVVVRDPNELSAFVRRCLTNPDFAKQLGQRAKSLVQKQQGATKETLSLLQHFL